MAYDFRANQVRLNRIISSGSLPIYIYASGSAADFHGTITFPTTGIGTDVFLFVSGSSTAKTLFGGDVGVSGSLVAPAISGSISETGGGLPFIIAGPNVTTAYNTLGQWEISGSAGGSFFTSPSNGVIQTTGSLLALGLSSSNGAQITGSLEVRGGITGSTHYVTGATPFVVAGPNITASYNSLGQWEITGANAPTPAPSYWTSPSVGVVYTTGSAYATTLSASLGLIVTGSFIQDWGGLCTANPVGGHAQGYNAHATGGHSHAEGEGSTASGVASHAEGSSTSASGRDAHAEGYSTTADGPGSHAEGDHSQTSVVVDLGGGGYAHAEGGYTQTFGNHSHAEGFGSVAYGAGSHAGGLYTIASGSDKPNDSITHPQTAVGKYNKQGNTTSLFVVGDGTGTTDALRHDVLRVESGSVQVTGSLAVLGGLTGSLQTTATGAPFVVGVGISANYNSLGQWELTGSSSGSGGFSPITSSLTVTGDGINQGSGSVGGMFNLSAGQVGKYEIQVTAVDSSGTNAAAWKYDVAAFYPVLGAFSFLGATELSYERTPLAATWDVNFNTLGFVEVTGSTGGTFFYTQVTSKMISIFGSIIF